MAQGVHFRLTQTVHTALAKIKAAPYSEKQESAGETSRSPSSEKFFPIGFFNKKPTNMSITISASFGSFRHISCFFSYLSKKNRFF